MSCPESDDLNAYFDDELDAPRRAALAEHLTGCTECSRELEAQKALRTGLQDATFRYRAPAGLAERIQSAIQPKTAHRWPIRSWLRIAAALLIGVGLGATGAFLLTTRAHIAAAGLSRDLVDAHVRSLMADHLEDVKSTDRHTVKPWFAGQVDFSPPVKDFKEQDYPLLGGRLDYVDERPAAVLVYGRAKHVINLFIWRAEPEGELPVEASYQRGYNLLNWRKGGLTFWAVSDLNAEELGEFGRLFREAP